MRLSLEKSTLYDQSDGALVVFDLANRTSFQNCQNWIQAYLEDAGIGTLCIVGNKSDLRTEDGLELITSNEGLNLAKELSEELDHPIAYLETSAKTGQNIHQAFVILATAFFDQL